MKLGMISYYSDSCFDYVKSKGLSFIEVARNNREESYEFVNSIENVKANIERTGLYIASVGRWGSEPNKAGKIDEEAMAETKALLGAAGNVGANAFVCGFNYDGSISPYKNYTAAINFFGELLDYAKKYDNIKVAVYNCDWSNFVCSPEQWNIIFGELPELMIKYDCSHSYYAGRDYLCEINNWAHKFAHMHVKGSVKINNHYMDDPPAGMDALEWRQIFAILYARGYNGNLSIEPHSATWRSESDLGKKGLDFTIKYISKFILN